MQEHRELQVARKAWESLPEGVNEDFEGYRAVKLPKIVLIMPRLQAWPQLYNAGEVKILVYPKPEHIPVFSRATSTVLQYASPAKEAPGAVGTVLFHSTLRGGRLGLTYAQAHFKTGDEPPYLPRKLATHYGGWRKRALAEVMKIALARGFGI